jgi:hypothetical protein
MKRKPLKNDIPKKIEERLSNWTGDYGSAVLKQLGNRLRGNPEGYLSISDKMHKEKFINNFLSAAYKSLNSEIAAGRVDPNLSGVTSAPQEKPTASTQQSQGQALDLDALKQRREAEKAAGIQSQQTAQAQMKATAASNAATAAADNQLVARVRAEKQKPGFQQNKGLIRQAAAKGIHESKYEKLNAIFESILQEAESIEQWLNRWLPSYLRGIPMNDTHSKSLIKAVGDTYARDKGKAALEKLAMAAFAASQSPGYGLAADNTRDTSSTVNTPAAVSNTTTSTNNATQIAGSIKSQMARLKQVDPTAYANLIKDLSSV